MFGAYLNKSVDVVGAINSIRFYNSSVAYVLEAK